MTAPATQRPTRATGVFTVTLDGEPAGSESWTLDRDGTTIQARSTITMRLPEPNRQELALAAAASGAFLKLEVVVQMGGGTRRARVAREGDVLQARVYEENAPAYENAFSAGGFEKVDFGSILTVVPLLASGRIGLGGGCELSGLLLPLPDLLPLEVRQTFRDQGVEPVILAGGMAVEARRISLVTRLDDGVSLASTLWVDADAVPLRQTLEHDGRVLDVSLLSRHDGPLPSGPPLPLIADNGPLR